MPFKRNDKLDNSYGENARWAMDELTTADMARKQKAAFHPDVPAKDRKALAEKSKAYHEKRVNDIADQWGPELGKMPPNREKGTPLNNNFRAHDEDKD